MKHPVKSNAARVITIKRGVKYFYFAQLLVTYFGFIKIWRSFHVRKYSGEVEMWKNIHWQVTGVEEEIKDYNELFGVKLYERVSFRDEHN
jgi:hypothetical protein